ncbi:MAG: hypothetical protein WBG90_15815 [Saonia sp.]
MNLNNLPFVIFFLICSNLYAQNIFSGEIGAGIGPVFGGEKLFRNKLEARGAIFSGIHYKMGEKISIGILGSTSIALDLPFVETDIQGEEITILDSFDVNANTLLFELQYQWIDKNYKPFISLGVGTNSFVRKLYFDENDKPIRAKKSSWAIAPKIGLQIENFNLSMNYLFAGKTPSFNGTDSDGFPRVLNEAKFGIFYFSASYNFDINL